VAGVLLAGYLGIPSLLIGNTYLLPTIAVVVLGGTSLLGGARQRRKRPPAAPSFSPSSSR
jgi:ribose/xylose/arabinose/galactoside ABC-type transport system permease subunit